jgi:hypothetical protein
MAKPFNEWTVLPHGSLVRLEDNLLTVYGMLRMPPMGDVDRRMTIARLRDGRLVVYSAIALGEAEMHSIEAFGTPTYLVVPSEIHRMDAKIWKDRYPDLKVIAPAGAREKVEKVVPVDATKVNFGDPSVRLVTIPGTGDGEMALIVQTDGQTTLVLNDIIFNLANRRGLSGWFFKKIGMTGDEPHIPPVVKRRLVDDDDALRRQLEEWSHLPHLKRVILSHGGIIANEAAHILGRVAEHLAA